MKPVIKLDENNVHHQMLVGVFAMLLHKEREAK